MNKLGKERVDPRSIVTTEGFEARLQKQDVEDLADSIRHHGLFHEPMVRKADLRIVHGEDRLAACLLLELPDIEVDMVEITDEEMEQVRRAENVHRRHEPEVRAKLALELVNLYEQEYLEEEERAKQEPAAEPAHRMGLELDEPKPRRKGKEKTARGKARERAAKELGIAPESVRKAEQRARAEEERQSKLELEPPVLTLGRKLSKERVAALTLVREAIDDAWNKLKAAQGALTRLGSAGVPVYRLQHLQEELTTVTALVRSFRPHSVCPYCKLVEEVRNHCSFCMTTGYMVDGQKAQVAPQLMREENPVIFYNGKYVLVSQFEPDAEPAEPHEDPEQLELDPEGDPADFEDGPLDDDDLSLELE